MSPAGEAAEPAAAAQDGESEAGTSASADAPPALSPGDGLRAVFPRMAGKARPGVVVHLLATGLVALPLTTRRTNQPGLFPMPEEELVGLRFEKRSHLVLPRAAYLPFTRTPRSTPSGGAVSEPMLAQILGEMVEWYGLDWRAGAEKLAETGAARLLHLRAKG